MFKTGVPLGDAGSEPCRRKTYAKKKSGSFLASQLAIKFEGRAPAFGQASVGPVLGDAAHGRK